MFTRRPRMLGARCERCRVRVGMLEHHLTRKFRATSDFPPPLYACLPAHTTINIRPLASVCLENTAADPETPSEPPSPPLLARNTRSIHEFRVPGARRNLATTAPSIPTTTVLEALDLPSSAPDACQIYEAVKQPTKACPRG